MRAVAVANRRTLESHRGDDDEREGNESCHRMGRAYCMPVSEGVVDWNERCGKNMSAAAEARGRW